MYALKFPPHILLPRPDSTGFLPAVLSGTLLLGLAMQFLLSNQTILPPSSNLMPRHQRAVAIPKVEDYAAIKQRPLFTPTRQFDEVSASATATAGTNGSFIIVGTTTGKALATAFVKNRDGTTAALHTGELHEGWLVQTIHLDRVTFTRADKRIDIPVGSRSDANGQTVATNQNTIAVQGQREAPNPEAEQPAPDSNTEEANQQ